jgi:flagellar basal-body rod protein FlgB
MWLASGDFGTPQLSLPPFEQIKGQRDAADTTSMNVTSSQAQLMTRLLDATALRQRVLGQNIANVNTPGYERREVQFEEQLAALLKANGTQIDQDALAELRPEIAATENLAKRTDGNNVNLEMEIGQLTKNEILYKTFSQILATDMAMLRTAITGN